MLSEYKLVLKHQKHTQRPIDIHTHTHTLHNLKIKKKPGEINLNIESILRWDGRIFHFLYIFMYFTIPMLSICTCRFCDQNNTINVIKSKIEIWGACATRQWEGVLYLVCKFCSLSSKILTAESFQYNGSYSPSCPYISMTLVVIFADLWNAGTTTLPQCNWLC